MSLAHHGAYRSRPNERQESEKLNQYEAMFIFDPTFATKFENAEKELMRIMDRASAQDVVAKKWDDRRLAYRIAGRKRGVFNPRAPST